MLKAGDSLPNDDYVLVNVHEFNIKSRDCSIKASAFKNTPSDGLDLSCNSSNFIDEEESVRRFVFKNKDGTQKNRIEQFGVAKLNVGNILNIENVENVVYDPVVGDPVIIDNEAHCLIIKPDTGPYVRIRSDLKEIAELALKPAKCIE